MDIAQDKSGLLEAVFLVQKINAMASTGSHRSKHKKQTCALFSEMVLCSVRH